MRRVILCAAFVVDALVGCATRLDDDQPVRCTEDMPCWDCETMGNGLCGPTHEGLAIS